MEVRHHLHEAAADRHVALFIAPDHTNLARLEHGQQGRVVWQYGQLALDSGRHKDVYILRVHHPLCCHDLQVHRGHRRPSAECLPFRLHAIGFLDCLFDGAHHVEGLLRQFVVLAVQDFLEAFHGVLDGHVAALLAGELLGYEEWLC